MKQVNITNSRRHCASSFDQQWPLLSEIPTAPLPQSQARVLLRKDGQPDRRADNSRPLRPRQEWVIYGGFAVAIIEDTVAVVSASDVELVAPHLWYLYESGKNVYAATGNGVFMHRLILGSQKGDGTHTDHRDGCGLNNWRENLRATTPRQNTARRRKHCVGQSRFKGVRPIGAKWAAEVRTRQGGGVKRFYLGLFLTEEAAALAYDAKALEIFGEFACTNFPTTQAA